MSVISVLELWIVSVTQEFPWEVFDIECLDLSINGDRNFILYSVYQDPAVSHMDLEGCMQGFRPEELLDEETLLVEKKPKRVMLYGCGCGEVSCMNVSALISGDGSIVQWSHFAVNLASVPYKWSESSGIALALPTITFNRNQYEQEIANTTQAWINRDKS